jgi:hypothetical protein
MWILRRLPPRTSSTFERLAKAGGVAFVVPQDGYRSRNDDRNLVEVKGVVIGGSSDFRCGGLFG